MTRLSICLQEFNSSCPTGVVLEEIDDDNVLHPQLIASDYASTVEDYVEFVREHADKINAETEINIAVSMDDVESTAVLEFGCEVAKAIKEAIGNATRDDIQ